MVSRKSRKISRVFKLLLLLVMMHPLSVLASSPAFDQAVQNYKARRYAQALSGFQTVLKSYPTDAMTHYYMALCYQGTNQISLARQQYELVLSSGANPQLRNYATSGLAQLGKYQPSFGSSSSPVSSSPASGRAGPSSGAPKIVGRLKVIEFYADW